MKNNKNFAEIIESSLWNFTAQCWQWDVTPPFGSLIGIQTTTGTIFGLVHNIQTGSMDPVRYPFPYQKTEEELKREQPQIFEFLKTTIHCLCVGYKEKGRFYATISPEPPKIHAFVHVLEPDSVKEFYRTDHFLHLIFGAENSIQNIDELLLAILKIQKNIHMLSETKLISFIKTYSFLTGNDYRRTKLFISRAQRLL